MTVPTNTQAMPPPRPMRDARGRLLPGCAPINPHGRPRTGLAWAEAIREAMEARDGQLKKQLVQMLVQYAARQPLSCDVEYLRRCAAARKAGEPEPEPPDQGAVVLPTVAESMKALELLLSYWAEKPVARVDATSGDLPLQAGEGRPVLGEADLRALTEIGRRAGMLPSSSG